MVMVERECRHDAGAQLVGLAMGKLQRTDLLEMVVQQPGVVDQGQQDQGFAARDRRALAAHDRARSKLGARRLIGAGGQLGRARLGLRRGGRPGGSGRRRMAARITFVAERIKVEAQRMLLAQWSNTDGEPETQLICGRLRFELARDNFVLAALPDAIVVPPPMNPVHRACAC